MKSVKAMKYTPKQLRLIAAEAEVDERTVVAWANGTRQPWPEKRERIEAAAKKVKGR